MSEVPSRPLRVTYTYTPGSNGKLRPYLWLRVARFDGSHAFTVNGLVDTGADSSVLPVQYASPLGYKADDLTRVSVAQVEGAANAWVPQRPVRATVAGIEEVEFEMRPIFVATLDALWGRADLMATFDIAVSEARQELTLTLGS